MVQDNLNHNKYFVIIIFVIIFKLYKNRSRIPDAKFREILQLFLLDIEATEVSEITKILCPTINKIFHYIRQIISEYCEANSIFAVGEIEFVASYSVESVKENEVVVQAVRCFWFVKTRR